MDVHDPKTRSYNMSKIRGQHTRPEIIVRRTCFGYGLRFRLHDKKLPGKPDLVFRRHRTVLFVNGCFWHSHDCRLGSVVPKTNTEFWQKKRARTVERDEENYSALQGMGWKVVVIWECETRNISRLHERIRGEFFADAGSSNLCRG